MPQSGYLTPSSFADLMTNGRGTNEMGKTALAVVNRLAMDMLGVEHTEDYLLQDMTPKSCAWGNDHEWEAIEAYKERFLCEVERPGFQVSRIRKYIGGTCDGLVGKTGGIEVKCPFNSGEHLANISEGKQIKQYMYQIQGYMLIYRRQWWDFVSYDPRFSAPFNLYVKRIERDNEMIDRIVKRCTIAHRLARSQTARVRKVYKGVAV